MIEYLTDPVMTLATDVRVGDYIASPVVGFADRVTAVRVTGGGVRPRYVEIETDSDGLTNEIRVRDVVRVGVVAA